MTRKTHTPEYISKAEYLRRKNNMFLEEAKKLNEQPRTLYFRDVTSAIKDGGLPVFIQGKNEFLDWNQPSVRDYIFKKIMRPTIS